MGADLIRKENAMSENDMNRRAAIGAVGATVAMGAAAAAIAQAPEKAPQAKTLKLFDKVDPSMITKGAPPLAYYPVPDGRIVFKTQEQLDAWQSEIRARLGVDLDGKLGLAAETCSAGCTDDCG